MSRRLVLLLTGLSLLTGCGYHLRGNIELPPELTQVYITGPDRDLVQQLSKALEQSGATIMESGKGAAVINMTTSEFERKLRTTDASGLATAYSFKYDVTYNLTASDGDRLQSAENIALLRTLDYDPTQQLQAEDEARFLKEEMQQEVVVQMLRRLSRI